MWQTQRYFWLTFALCFFSTLVLAQADWVHAIVLRDQQTVEALEDGTFFHTEFLEVQVNDRKAANYYRSNFVSYDPKTEILEFKGTLLSAGEKKPEKSKKRHLTDKAYYDGYTIASDNRYKKLELDLPSKYPAVYTFKSSVKYIETVGLPLISYQYPEGVVVKSASLNLIDPSERINYKVIDPSGLFVERETSGTHSFLLKNPPVTKNSNRDFLLDIGPAILLTPKSIRLEGTTGDFSSWSDMATWSASLLDAAGSLPASAVAEIKALVKDVQTDEERIAAVYSFVQQRSHYVSIQLGIGGWKPMSPSEVHASGYGDCKALTNYTRLLLEVVGVRAAYCVIGVQNREIRFPDFASANQANHAMLAVPRVRDTVWLECTSQQTPAGYISNSASGRYALWVDESEGKLVRTSGATPMENELIRHSTIMLDKDGGAQLLQIQRRRGDWLDLPLALQNEMAEDQRRIVRRLFTHTLNELRVKVDLPNGVIHPEATVEIEAMIPTYAKQLGGRFMLPAFTLQKSSNTLQQIFDADDFVRLEEVSFKQDTVRYIPPAGMRITQLPESVVHTTPYLNYSLSAKPTLGGVEVVRELTLRKTQLEGTALDEAKEIVEAILRADRSVLGVVNE